MDIASALDSFIVKYIEEHQGQNRDLVIDYDENWPSECYMDVQPNGQVPWRPKIRSNVGSFDALESALNLKMNDQLSVYFSRYWSDNLNAKNVRGNLQLLQAWNQADFERLQENLIGHILMKRRLKQPETWFFAVTDEDDFILSVDNQTGAVVLERVGLLPQEVLAENLATFIEQLSPAVT